MRQIGVTSALYAIIRGRDLPWGNLSVYTRAKRAFGLSDLQFLQSVADILALALERREIEIAHGRDRERLQAVFDNIPVMILFHDQSSRVERVNPEWERVLGWTLPDVEETDILAHAYPDIADRRRVLDVIEQSDRRWHEFEPKSREGRVLHTSWAAFTLSDGSKVAVGMDLTDRRDEQAERDRLFEAERVARAAAERALAKLCSIQAITDSGLIYLNVEDLSLIHI